MDTTSVLHSLLDSVNFQIVVQCYGLWLLIYQDVFAIHLRIFDWFFWIYEILDLLAKPHNSTLQVQIDFIFAVFSSLLFSNVDLDLPLIIQNSDFIFVSICFNR